MRTLTLLCSLLAALPAAMAELPSPTLEPLVRAVDLNQGETAEVTLCNDRTVEVTLLECESTRDPIRNAVRLARVRVRVEGEEVWLDAANYRLPVTVGEVQIDCPVTKAYVANSRSNAWGLQKDARLRLWPADSPLLRPGTFVYPVKQRWFASATQMGNEPCYVDAAERPSVRNIYYHYGLDFGGAEGLVEVVAATDGLVVSRGTDRLPGYADTPVNPRYDVVYVRDDRGWFYRYSHLYSIDDSVELGERIEMGQPIGILGKEGGSGGWSHLHFDIACRQPSGDWGSQDAYAFAWEAYQRQYEPELIAVARPHHVATIGQTVALDGSRSWTAAERITDFRWTLSDGSEAEGARIERSYNEPGYYSEILHATDSAGNEDYDFAIVHVFDPEQLDRFPPTIHLVYFPTFDIHVGDEVTFKVRTFATTDGHETIDFGDGSPPVEAQSDGNAEVHAPDGYAVVKHVFTEPGDYVVTAQRSDRYGHTATAHVHVTVKE